MKTQRTWLFECNDWLSLHHGIGSNAVQLSVARELAKYAQTEYEVVTVTGDRKNAATDANV
jgi:hypothetical protein